MDIKLSLLSKHKTLVGISIEKNGKVKRDSRDKAVFQTTIDITIGLLFGYIVLEFNSGKSVDIVDMLEEFSTKVEELKEVK